MAPSVWLTSAATPSLPLPPMPVGQAMVLPNDLSAPPSFATQARARLGEEVGEHRRRAGAVGAVHGSDRLVRQVRLGLSFLIAGSFHFVMSPVKILPIVSPSKFRPPDALDVVGDGDRAEHERDVQDRPALGGGQLGVEHRRVACAEVDRLRVDLRDAAARPDRLVGDVRALLGVGRGPHRHDGRDEGRARAAERRRRTRDRLDGVG